MLAALELGVSHNRWHVMKQVGAMLSLAADKGLSAIRCALPQGPSKTIGSTAGIIETDAAASG